ncbi:uncharacterized protein LOC123683796 isoform X3 [Harmonia axyridis]|uniref:uncharacterized protein LOC123683796 isoform X3 n=1 Tax=Harmonia axyridis TaxID=115357 RepID=UPI001E275202|nr:uncharacterized protein LOC123683796 isoform X3 [Harmonia axyridis]
MDDANDPIKALIEKTGLSCDDLLQKLLQYKNQQSKGSDESSKAAPPIQSTDQKSENQIDTSKVNNSESNDSGDAGATANQANDSNGDLTIEEVHQKQVLEEPIKETIENTSSEDVEHEKEASGVGLKDGPCELKGNSTTSSSEPTICLEDNEKGQVKPKEANIDDSTSEDQGNVSNVPLLEKNSAFEDFSSESKNESDDVQCNISQILDASEISEKNFDSNGNPTFDCSNIPSKEKSISNESLGRLSESVSETNRVNSNNSQNENTPQISEENIDSNGDSTFDCSNIPSKEKSISNESLERLSESVSETNRVNSNNSQNENTPQISEENIDSNGDSTFDCSNITNKEKSISNESLERLSESVSETNRVNSNNSQNENTPQISEENIDSNGDSTFDCSNITNKEKSISNESLERLGESVSQTNRVNSNNSQNENNPQISEKKINSDGDSTFDCSNIPSKEKSISNESIERLGESVSQTNRVNSNNSQNENTPQISEKNIDSNGDSTFDCSNISNREKSISYESIERLSESVSQTNGVNSNNSQNENTPQISEKNIDSNGDSTFDCSNIPSKEKSISNESLERLSESQTKRSENKTIGDLKENDIEVCQIEDVEVKPLLKLRSDLFANNFKGNFHTTDEEDENEENNLEIKEFLKNVEEVTAEVKNHSPVKSSSSDVIEEPAKPNISRLRRVKMGFVKKRILHKAIKYIYDSKSRKMEKLQTGNNVSQTTEKSHCENDTKKDSEEEIRKNLKLQLDSLRNRKKSTNTKDKYPAEKLKTNYNKHIYGKKRATDRLNAVNTSDVEDSSSLNVEPERRSSDDNDHVNPGGTTESGESLFSLSKNTDFMIIDVQGGVELPEIESEGNKEKAPSEEVEIPEIESEERREREKAPSDLIKLTKTNDVTKIKGWQNKKFQLQKGDNSKDSEKAENNTKEINHCDIFVPSCSTRIINERKNEHNINGEISKNEQNNKEELSPFVSNSLEEFLTENSTLNISYNIPKLGAEDGIITKKYDSVIIPHSVEPATCDTEKKEEVEKEKSRSMKPKTLAEKRRMLENSKSKTDSDKKEFNKTSYVLYNGSKLFVPTLFSKKCLQEIKFKPKLKHKNFTNAKRTAINKKLSLLGIYHENSSSISYKPAPLRKKVILQDETSASEWDTEIRKLPTIKLNIIPEIGKSVPPHLEHYFKFSPIIKEDRLELALNAVSDKSTKTKKKQGFSLTVPYANNQKYVLVRKRKKMSQNVIYDVPAERNTVKSVLDDIISYVEHKENEDLIIKDAEVYKDQDHDNESCSLNESSPPKKSKRRKLDSELLRLSCKVLSVSVDESEENRTKCPKSFCKLGCVCKSLNCFTRLPMHCSKLECMFECKCSASQNISLDGESSMLPCDTVWRLEDQAKRDLAKVEKEFTQTIIHTNNKTILIPSSDRKKTKRVKRMPKRYSDFLEDFNIDEKVSKENDYNLKQLSNCRVLLKKLDMKGIIPLCLYHDCYDCACLSSPDKKSNPTSSFEIQEVVQSKPMKKKKPPSPSIERKRPSNDSKEQRPIDHSEGNTSDSEYMEELKIADSRKLKGRGGCARASGVHPEVLARNEIPFYKNKLRLKVAQAESTSFVDISHIKSSYSEPVKDLIDVTKPMQISAADRVKLFIAKNRRKRQASDELDILWNKAKKSKKISKESINEPIDQNKKEENLPYTPVFNGEIIVPTNENEDFVRKLGVKSAAQFMRLLPWDDLLKNYYDNTINIWCPNNSNNKLLMNKSDKGPPQGYIEITESKRKNGIMNWILSKKLPKNTPSELVHLILSPKNEYFEISGICLKNITEEEKNKKYYEEKKNPQLNISKDVHIFKHKNHANQEQTLIMSLKVHSKKDLYIVSSSQSVIHENNFVSVELPAYDSIRWRMVFLNSNFSFLSFIRMDYSIKYTDLKTILKMAQDSNKTICLQSKILSQGYCQQNFGIYAVPNFKDNLFIGPFGFNEDHNLQTLRYLRQELVPTEYFEMVQGGVIPNKKKDVWLISKDALFKKNIPSTLPQSSNERSKPITVDPEYAVLTPLPSSSAKSKPDKKSADSNLKTPNVYDLTYYHSLDENAQFITSMDLEEKAFINLPQFTILNGKKLRQQDYNCYLVTNVPNIGYMGAVKNGENLEVDWPFGNKTLRFLNVLRATQFIRRRFMNLLLPVPASFNLRVLLKEDLDNLDNLTPVDPKLLNGTHICGSFGILDSRKLTPQLAQTLGTTQEDVLERLAKRAQFLGSLEIDKVKATEKKLIDTKKKLIMQKQSYLKRYMDLLMDFPEEKRLKEYSKFRQLFNGGSSTAKVSSEKSSKDSEDIECIEIEDSDSEEDTSAETKEANGRSDVSPKKPVGMKSILKPKIIPQSTPSTSDSESSRPVENFKLVKTATGKLVLVKDTSGVSLSKTLSGMKLKIRNNKVIDDTN